MTTPTATDFAALGISLPSNPRTQARTTCPQCSASRRKARKRDLVVQTETGFFCCHHCGWKGKAGGGTSRGDGPVVRPAATPDEKHRRRLQRTWDLAYPLAPRDPVMQYLRERGLLLPANQIPPALRYHPRLQYFPDDATEARSVHPGMVARIDDAQGRPINVHRTFLTPSGQKAAVATVRKLMSPLVEGGTKGSAIRLYRPGDTLCLTEGIETALAVHLSTGLPVWAAICASLLQEVQLPLSVRCVAICADHDHNQVGLQAAQALAQRLRQEGRRVAILLPDTVGTDWLDVYDDPQATPLTLARIETEWDRWQALGNFSNFSKTLAKEGFSQPSAISTDCGNFSNFSNFSRGGTSHSTSQTTGTGTSYASRLAVSVARYQRQLYADPYFGADERRAKGIPVATLIQKETPHA